LNWDVLDFLNNNWLTGSTLVRNKVLSIEANYWGFNSLIVDWNWFIGKYWFVYIWNNINWDIILLSNCECADFFIRFWFQWVFHINSFDWFSNWNESSVINNNWFYCFVCNWEILLTVYINNNFWWSFNIWNYSIFENSLVLLWNNCQWNVSRFTDLDCVNFFVNWGLNCLLNNNIFWSLNYWNVVFAHNNCRVYCFVADWDIVLSIYRDSDWSFHNLNFFNFVVENWSVAFWNSL